MSAFVHTEDFINRLVNLSVLGPDESPPNSMPVFGPMKNLDWRGDTYYTGYAGDKQGRHVTEYPQEREQLEGHLLTIDITPQTLGQMLWDTNKQSVHTRYQESHVPNLDIAETYTYKPLKRSCSALAGIKMLHSYSYQSCEFEGWELSEAWWWTWYTINYLTSNLPGFDRLEGCWS